jgi:Flp pilus assembly protein TadG
MKGTRSAAAPSDRRSRRPRRFAGEGGQALVELGIMLPLLLILIIGVLEVNNGLNAYITVINSSRDGARLGSKGAATTAEIQALVVRDLDRLPNTTPASNVTVTYPTVSGVNAVKVVSCYDHTTILQVPLIMPGSMQLCAQTTMPKLN